MHERVPRGSHDYPRTRYYSSHALRFSVDVLASVQFDNIWSQLLALAPELEEGQSMSRVPRS